MLTPADDYVHPIGPEPNFNESMYFHFFDPLHRVGGFVRLANRPNEGRGERTVCLYLADGSVAFGYARPEFADSSRFDAGGLTVESVAPFERLRVSFEGLVNVLDDPAAMADPKAALSASPTAQCNIAFDLTALAPPHAETFDGEGESFAPNHYEQLMQVAGTVQLGDRTFAVAGHGLRDHSWGPRSWQAPWFYRWLHGSSSTLGFMGALFGDEDGAERTGGFVWDGEQLHPCSGVTVVTSRDRDHTPQAVTVSLIGDGTTWTFTGKAQSSIPLRHRSSDGRTNTRISETAMTWTTDGDTRVHGMAEYLDQMADGVPVGLRV